MQIHWAWVPAAILAAIVGWSRFGPGVALALITAGLGLALFLEWRARRRAP